MTTSQREQFIAAATNAANRWYRKALETVDEDVSAWLKRALIEVLQKKVGLETNFGEVRIVYESPLRIQIEKKAMEEARRLLDNIHFEIPEKARSTILEEAARIYRNGYKETLCECAEKAGNDAALEDIEEAAEAIRRSITNTKPPKKPASRKSQRPRVKATLKNG